MQKHLHIISFDIPYPANYGGAIDVFHKIRWLHKQGIKVILHCFEYGSKSRSDSLEKICEKVYYYKRDMSFINHFSFLPFNVKSRINTALKQNLLKDDYPILFEVLHTCYLLNDFDLKNKKKIFRHSNIEHHYFLELAKGEKSILKKIYLKIEAIKLKRFEKQITHANCILSVSETDLNYFKKTYTNTPSIYLPSFHEYDAMQSEKGYGKYILYHGNLSISENYNAVIWLIESVFSKIDFPVIIAGLNPPDFLKNKIKKHNNISLKENCSHNEMQQLITNAQIHCLYTKQATGLKLKLLNVLFSGRFILTNKAMLEGTSFNKMCVLAETPQQYIDEINKLMHLQFSQSEIELREKNLFAIQNINKVNQLIQLLY
jgi:hypothetical protein